MTRLKKLYLSIKQERRLSQTGKNLTFLLLFLNAVVEFNTISVTIYHRFVIFLRVDFDEIVCTRRFVFWVLDNILSQSSA